MARRRRTAATAPATRATTANATVPPMPTAAATMTPEAIRQAIADGVNAVLAEQTRNGNASTQAVPATHQCTYKDFTACQPTYFKGTEGVTELAHWFERVETVFQRSGCTDDCKVTFAT